MRRFVTLASLLVVTPPSTLLAQRLAKIGSLVAPSPIFAQHLSASLQDARHAPGDYRLEGTVAGGLLLGALGFWIGTQACDNQRQPAGSGATSCSAVPVGLVGAALGSGVGYLLGRLTPKHR